MRAWTLLGALLLDRLRGQPRHHPVRAIGLLLARAGAARRAERPAGAFTEGLATLALTVTGTAAIAAKLDRAIASLRQVGHSRVGTAAEIACLQPSLALEALLTAGSRVGSTLAAGNLAGARRALQRDLVSRDTSALPPELVASAAIESLAENLCDSVVAPGCAYLAAGLSGAWAYRVVNTADAMFGYRTADLYWFGKPAARLDDALNFLPARLSALLVVAASGRPHSLRTLAAVRQEASRTTSPNAGWPMAAAAVVLGVRLEKPGSYILNADGDTPGPRDIQRAVVLLRRAGWLGAILALACGVAPGLQGA